MSRVLFIILNNSVLIQWYSENYHSGTADRHFVFPITYTTDYWIIGTGFWLDGYCTQYIANKNLAGFSTGSDNHRCSTTGWITIGI